jgi:hypothetical protein
MLGLGRLDAWGDGVTVELFGVGRQFVADRVVQRLATNQWNRARRGPAPRRCGGSRTAAVDQLGLDVLTETVVDGGATFGSGVELSGGIHPAPGLQHE